MSNYLTFHQAKLNQDDVAIKLLFGLNTNIHIGLQQLISPPVRSPRNPNQIIIADKVDILPSEYNRFDNSQYAYEAVVAFLSEEFQITFDENIYFVKEEYSNKNKSLYFYVFEHFDTDEQPKLRGVLYVTTSTIKPSVWVALSENLEYEYDSKIYK